MAVDDIDGHRRGKREKKGSPRVLPRFGLGAENE